MPNSQTHIVAVYELLAQPPIRSAFPWLAEHGVQAAFLLGAIGPDVRALSGHSREATHFFDIPPTDPRLAHEIMFETWPKLGHVAALDRDHVAFVAGYVTHLIMDQTWVEMIVMPHLFINGLRWGTHHPNWRVYSLLMTYLEYQAAACFPAEATAQLAQAAPRNWLPFVEDQHLEKWRDHVVAHIVEGGARRISHFFAHSNGLSPEELEMIVASEERMDNEAFGIVPRERLIAFSREAARRSQNVVLAYLADTFTIHKEQP